MTPLRYTFVLTTFIVFFSSSISAQLHGTPKRHDIHSPHEQKETHHEYERYDDGYSTTPHPHQHDESIGHDNYYHEEEKTHHAPAHAESYQAPADDSYYDDSYYEEPYEHEAQTLPAHYDERYEQYDEGHYEIDPAAPNPYKRGAHSEVYDEGSYYEEPDDYYEPYEEEDYSDEYNYSDDEVYEY